MEDSESDNDGQLLIDESVDTSKKKARSRKCAPKSKKIIPKKMKLQKTVSSSEKRKSQRKQQSEKETSKVVPETVGKVRTSSRVRKRIRRHSPSPVRTKKEPPKKKLKVKFKNIKKLKQTPRKKNAATSSQNSKDSSNIDIESISDEELNNIQYSSVIIDEDPPLKPAKKQKSKSIKLKLSLGKVLSVEDSKPEIIEKQDMSSSIESWLGSTAPDEPETPVVQPLIITKRQNSSSSGERYNIATQSSTCNSENEFNSTASSTDSSFYSTSSEHHKPLTLKLSMGRPKVAKQYSVVEAERKTEKVFPNIRRSWSVAGSVQNEFKAVEPAEIMAKTEAKAKNDKLKSVAVSPPHLSTTPYFNAGLQSLLDVVSVEIKEQNKCSSDISNEKLAQQKPIQSPDPLKQPLPLESHFLIRPTSNLPKASTNASNHEGHLPSLTFPKPKLNFAVKKRVKGKTTTKPSQEPPSLLLSSVFESKSDNVDSDNEATEELPDKEKRRRDKKKILNSDFVDPDTLMSGPDPKQKEDPAWKKPATNSQQKLGGFSLLMPQMISQDDNADDGKGLLQMGSTCRLPQKNLGLLSKKPRKGLATAKQRLANKLKLGKTYAY